MASIFIVQGLSTPQYYPLGVRTTVIGRDESLLVQVVDEHVSRKHLQIHYNKDDKQYYAVDMKSKNGVLLNGAQMDQDTPLVNGDVLKIGETQIFFLTEDFADRKSALDKFKKVGERKKTTL